MKPVNSPVTTEEANRKFAYDPTTGFITWKSCYFPSRNGQRAESKGSDGYLRVRLVGRSTSLAHRVAWLMAYGAWPANSIDHINGDKTDNRLSNLRDVSHAENLQNLSRAYRNNRTGLLGVYKRKWGKFRYEARINLNGESIFVGAYATPEEAHVAYVVAKRQLHPTCVI